MRVLRRYRNWTLSCGLVLCISLTVYYYSNAFDLVFHFISLGYYELPLSLHCNLGRLGNQMCTYATLYGLSALNHRRRFVVLNCNKKHLEQIFVGPSKAESTSIDRYIKQHRWSILPYLKTEDASIPNDSNFIHGYYYPCSYTFFDHVKDGIRQQFQFKEHLKQYAQDVLRKANVHHLPNVTYVSVHVRRGDYIKHWLEVFVGVPVNYEYFQKAFSYFRDKYKNIIFIAVSEDRQWCIDNLSKQFRVYVPDSAPSPAHDLAVLANVNHSILSYGTFGFWGAYLAGGEVVYFDKFLKPNTTFTLKEFLFEKMYPPEWKGIATLNASYWLEKEEEEKRVKEEEEKRVKEEELKIEEELAKEDKLAKE